MIREYLPGIPANYLSVISSVSLHAKSLGFFNLWAGSVHRSFAANLIEANYDMDILDESARPIPGEHGGNELVPVHGPDLYEVASFEACPIVVARKGSSYGEGIVLVKFHDAPDLAPVRLCRDFETFLLLVGNMFEIGTRLGESDEAVQEFRSVLSGFSLQSQETEAWMEFAEGVLEPLPEIEERSFGDVVSGLVKAVWGWFQQEREKS